MFLSVINVIFESVKLTTSHQVNPIYFFWLKITLTIIVYFFTLKKLIRLATWPEQ
jgi:hypothetical protein